MGLRYYKRKTAKNAIHKNYQARKMQDIAGRKQQKKVNYNKLGKNSPYILRINRLCA